MGDYGAVLESQFRQLTSMKTEFADSIKLSVMVSTLKEWTEFKALITLVGVMG